MEFILNKTTIFDENIDEKFSEVLKSSRDSLSAGNVYKFTVSFHVNLLNDPRFEEFILPVSRKRSNDTRKDKIYDVMSFQLKKLEKVLEEIDIEVYSTTIQGDQLAEENIVKIDIDKDLTSNQNTLGKGKNTKRGKVSSVIPSLPFTQQNITNIASERISKLFNELMNIIKNKKIMSDILEIDETEDEKKLFKAFAKRYGGLWLTTSEKEKELLDQLRNRCEYVLKQYSEEKEKD
ncbi:hypothetical protein [Alkalihalobacillus trypoxylicola]|uniref:Uncharacterized protein n=1 Tax=Alkalihalobacillus trypoxylicola TaxID=519424 RepID=A0A162D5R0_9BACI|nr:hypothetical protein [Alkalihalobacillus trypoxylicola]KYG28209.1 hypothetical protein AZF04_09930 [Alkalihalobacillus trypoxylicola]